MNIDREKKEREFMKRYFSNMVDLYPDDAAQFIHARETAKRARYEADKAYEKAKVKMLQMFDVYDQEPAVNTDDLMT